MIPQKKFPSTTDIFMNSLQGFNKDNLCIVARISAVQPSLGLRLCIPNQALATNPSNGDSIHGGVIWARCKRIPAYLTSQALLSLDAGKQKNPQPAD